MLPFDLQGGLPLSAARALMVGAVLSTFGALVFRVLVAPRACAPMTPEAVRVGKQRLLVVSQVSALAGLLAAILWLYLQAADMADAEGAARVLAALIPVLTRTLFGHVLGAQFAALLAASALIGVVDVAWRQRAALGMTTLAVALQAGHSHAYAMYGGASVLLGCDVVHLLAAGAWLGGLVPLLLWVRCAPPKTGASAARRFSPLGQGCIAALVLSATVQGWILVGTVPGLVGTAYGWMVLVKIGLFAVLLGFAAANRYRFAPALLHDRPVTAKTVLVRSIALQTGFAIAIVAAASVLSALPPAMHEQPAWPFPERFSLAAVNEDPDFLREVVQAGVLLAGAGLVLTLCVSARRFRLTACALAAVSVWFELPHLDLLLVTAYPTSFYRSPTGFAAAAIVSGQSVYAAHCVVCHGREGRGDGVAAKTLPVPAADLTAPHLWMHSDGELFWWLAHGILTPGGVQAMPGLATVLDDDQRWAAIDFIRARNAGGTLRATGGWTPPLLAPGFDLSCGTTYIALSGLRGRFVLLRFSQAPLSQVGFGHEPDRPRIGTAVSILAMPAGQAAPPDDCVSTDETVAPAYAIVSGVDVASLPGTEFLIDERGWLRAVHRAGTAPLWSAAALQAEIRLLRAHPVADAAVAPMKMPM